MAMMKIPIIIFASVLLCVPSLYVGFVVWMHILAWLAALAFGRQFLASITGVTRPAIGLWLTMLLLVTLQMTTYVRPVLWRNAGEPLFQREKKSFFRHVHEVGQWEPAAATPTPAASAAGAPRR